MLRKPLSITALAVLLAALNVIAHVSKPSNLPAVESIQSELAIAPGQRRRGLSVCLLGFGGVSLVLGAVSGCGGRRGWVGGHRASGGDYWTRVG